MPHKGYHQTEEHKKNNNQSRKEGRLHPNVRRKMAIYIVICVICGKEFSQTANKVRRTCSRICWNELNARKKRGKRLSEETKIKQSNAMKRNISAGIGRTLQGRGVIKKGCKFAPIENPAFVCPNCGVQHGISHFWGKHASEETKQKMRSIFRVVFNTPEIRKIRSDITKELWGNLTPEQIEERRKILKESSNKPERIEQNRKNSQKMWNNRSPEEREIITSKMVQWTREDENRAWRANETREMWNNGTFDGVFTSPTSIEIKTFSFLDKLGIKYDKFHRINIGYKNRIVDAFIEPNICIEADGEYWHGEDVFGKNRKEEDAKTDKDLRKLGYIVYRILEADFDTDKYLGILEKIISDNNLSSKSDD